MIVPSFTIIWFGLGACVVGLLLLPAPSLPLAAQIFLWAVFSTVFTILWFRVFRPRMTDQTTSGMSKEAILGEVGMILRPIASPLQKGRIRFSIPLLGAEEWDCMSPDTLAAGDYARVTGIEGHVLTVSKK
jgi:membrane protein implicated in regulation of membrane protease activity